MENDDVADAQDGEAVRARDDFGNEEVFVLFVVIELDFDELVVGEGGVEGGEEGFGESGFTDTEERFEPLGIGFEAAELRAGKAGHIGEGR